MPAERRSITVAAGQTLALPLSGADEALAAVARLARRAAGAGADLVVLPECAYPAYWIESVETYRRAAVRRSADYVAWLRGLARELRIHIVSGFIEEWGGRLADSAVLVAPDGSELGRHRKTFLWGRDNDWFAPGDRIDVFDSPLGRIGLIICAEARCPEVAATLAAKGADLIAMATCWFNTGRAPGEYTNPQVEFMIESRAREFGVPFVCADKSGRDGDHVGYCGRSLIVGADGERLAEAPAKGESLLVSRVSLRAPHGVRVSEDERRRLLSADEPPRPVAKTAPVSVAVVPGRAALEVNGSCGREALRISRLDGDAIGRFAPARVAALDGAAAIFARGPLRDDVDLRTRAVENRVWAVAASEDRAVVVAPDGSVVGRRRPGDHEPLIVTIDPAVAADKVVTAGTDVFAQRRPRVYAF